MIDEAYITKLTEEKTEGTDIFIVEVKMTAGKLMVFLDKPTGLTIQECAEISRYIQTYIEESGILDNHDLEVSSPGTDYPLRVIQQYHRRVGREVKVVTNDNVEKTGILLTVTDDGIEIKETITHKEKNKKITETVDSMLPFSAIKETKVVISFKK
jgi:ribosome maturation factor RimP